MGSHPRAATGGGRARGSGPPPRLLRGRTLQGEGGVLLRGGRIERALSSAAALRRAERSHGIRALDLGGRWILPGLVNAHAHLELSGMSARAGEPFPAWVRSVVEHRRGRGHEELARDAAGGERRALETGSTTIGDVDSSGAILSGAGRVRARVVVLREVLDAWDPGRTAGALATLARALPRRVHRREGISPHAPHTASRALLAAVSELKRRRRIPVQIHWSETPEEIEWLRSGGGPFRDLCGPSPRTDGLSLIAQAGLLSKGTSLVHGNHPGRDEPGRIAEAGAVLVRCPGTHAFFQRPPFPWKRYLRAGVRIALGTDSLASNLDLDIAREMALVRAEAPFLAPEEVWSMATANGALALGLEGEVGCLASGAAADLLVVESDAGAGRDLLEEVTAGKLRISEAWVAGRRSALGASPRGVAPAAGFPAGPRRQVPSGTPSDVHSGSRSSPRRSPRR